MPPNYKNGTNIGNIFKISKQIYMPPNYKNGTNIGNLFNMSKPNIQKSFKY
jgi:hypothetical protein